MSDRGRFLEALKSRPELIEHGRYATGIQRFVDRFGPESLYVAVFDDLVSDPQSFIDDLLRWLAIDPLALSDELLATRLPAGAARSATLARWARKAADVVRERDGANLVGRVKRSPVVQKTLYRTLADDKPVMSDADRAAVHEALVDEVASLDRDYGLGLAERWGWVVPEEVSADHKEP